MNALQLLVRANQLPCSLLPSGKHLNSSILLTSGLPGKKQIVQNAIDIYIKAEGRGQRAEGRGLRAEGRGQRAEGRGLREGFGFIEGQKKNIENEKNILFNQFCAYFRICFCAMAVGKSFATG